MGLAIDGAPDSGVGVFGQDSVQAERFQAGRVPFMAVWADCKFELVFGYFDLFREGTFPYLDFIFIGIFIEPDFIDFWGCVSEESEGSFSGYWVKTKITDNGSDCCYSHDCIREGSHPGLVEKSGPAESCCEVIDWPLERGFV